MNKAKEKYIGFTVQWIEEINALREAKEAKKKNRQKKQ